MGHNLHIIERCAFRVDIANRKKATLVYEAISQFVERNLPTLLEKALDTLDYDKSRYLQIDRLTLDVGTLREGQLGADLLNGLERVLQESLRQAVQEAQPPLPRYDHLLQLQDFFLKHGYFPSWAAESTAPESPVAIFAELLKAPETAARLRHWLSRPLIRRRLLEQMPPALLRESAYAVAPRTAERYETWLRQLLEMLRREQLAVPERFEKWFWQLALLRIALPAQSVDTAAFWAGLQKEIPVSSDTPPELKAVLYYLERGHWPPGAATDKADPSTQTMVRWEKALHALKPLPTTESTETATFQKEAAAQPDTPDEYKALAYYLERGHWPPDTPMPADSVADVLLRWLSGAPHYRMAVLSTLYQKMRGGLVERLLQQFSPTVWRAIVAVYLPDQGEAVQKWVEQSAATPLQTEKGKSETVARWKKALHTLLSLPQAESVDAAAFWTALQQEEATTPAPVAGLAEEEALTYYLERGHWPPDTPMPATSIADVLLRWLSGAPYHPMSVLSTLYQKMRDGLVERLLQQFSPTVWQAIVAVYLPGQGEAVQQWVEQSAAILPQTEKNKPDPSDQTVMRWKKALHTLLSQPESANAAAFWTALQQEDAITPAVSGQAADRLREEEALVYYIEQGHWPPNTPIPAMAAPLLQETQVEEAAAAPSEIALPSPAEHLRTELKTIWLFLSQGTLPPGAVWQTTAVLEQILRQLAEKHPNLLRPLLRQAFVRSVAVERLLGYFSEDLWFVLGKVLLPFNFDTTLRLPDELFALWTQLPEQTNREQLERSFWAHTFAFAAQVPPTAPESANKTWMADYATGLITASSAAIQTPETALWQQLYETSQRQGTKGLLASLLHERSRQHGATQPQKAARPVSSATEDLPPSTALAIHNAGLALLAPFLPRYFDTLGLLENRLFRDAAAAERAVHLLQYLASGQSETPEHLLVFNKILCGLPLETPVATGIELSTLEIETSTSLLEAVIQNWEIMKNSTVQNLQGAFLLREGRLTGDEVRWQLHVAEKAYDIVLEYLPWTISMLKLPWMDKRIDITWKKKS